MYGLWTIITYNRCNLSLYCLISSSSCGWPCNSSDAPALLIKVADNHDTTLFKPVSDVQWPVGNMLHLSCSFTSLTEQLINYFSLHWNRYFLLLLFTGCNKFMKYVRQEWSLLLAPESTFSGALHQVIVFVRGCVHLFMKAAAARLSTVAWLLLCPLTCLPACLMS